MELAGAERSDATAAFLRLDGRALVIRECPVRVLEDIHLGETGCDLLATQIATVDREIDHGAPLWLDWRVLRSFSKKQRLAKRLWIYLAAERWKREGESEATWVAVGDRLFAALGMAESRPHRQCRASLKHACETVCRVDPRLDAGGV